MPSPSATDSPATHGSPPTLGTLAWGQLRGGRLTAKEQFTIARQATHAQLAAMPGILRVALFGPVNKRSAPLVHRPLPDTALTRDALKQITEAGPAPLVGHALRCWCFADLFAQRDAISVDPEALCLCCLLHDLSLADNRRPDASAGCFAVHGAGAAGARLEAMGADQPLITRVGEAISLHFSPRVELDLSVEGHLLQAAAYLDTAGYRIAQLPGSALRDVLSRHPRDGFTDLFTSRMREEARDRPRSRAALLWRLGSGLALKTNPLDRIKPQSTEAGGSSPPRMVLYTCPARTHAANAPIHRHSCAVAAQALDRAGYSYTVKVVGGFKYIPLSRRGKRGEIRALTGQDDVPVLVLDDGTPVHGTSAIVDWAAGHAAKQG